MLWFSGQSAEGHPWKARPLMYLGDLGQWNSPEGLRCSALRLFDLLISCPSSFISHWLAQPANVHIWQNLFRWDQQKRGRSWKQLMKLWDLHFTLIFLPHNLPVLDADSGRITEVNSNAGLPVEKRLGDVSDRGRHVLRARRSQGTASREASRMSIWEELLLIKVIGGKLTITFETYMY